MATTELRSILKRENSTSVNASVSQSLKKRRVSWGDDEKENLETRSDGQHENAASPWYSGLLGVVKPVYLKALGRRQSKSN